MLLDQRPGLVTIGSLDDVVVVGTDNCRRQHPIGRLVVGDDHGVADAVRRDRSAIHGFTSRGVRASTMKAAASLAAPECFFSTATTPAVRSASVSAAVSSLIVTTTTGTSLPGEVRNAIRKSWPLAPGNLRSSITARAGICAIR